MKMLNRNKAIAFSLITITSLLSGCGSESDSEIITSQSEVDLAIETAIKESTVPAIDDFALKISTLNTEIDNFCTGPADTTKLSTVQNAWKDSFNSWYGVLPFKFGPLSITNNSSAALDYIDFYRNATAANQTIFLDNSNSEISTFIDAAGTISETSLSNSRPKELGLLTLETALFETLAGDSTTASNIVIDFNNETEKCDFIQAIGYELNTRTTTIQNQWKVDYRNTGISYQTLFSQNTLEEYFSSFDDDGKGTPASEAVVVSIQEFLDFIGNADIINELNRYGNDTIWSALAKSVDSIEKILDQSDTTELSIYAVMKNNGYEQDVETIKTNIIDLKDKITNKNITDFEAAAKALDGNFKTSVINGLNINKGLTFADGDS